jgi:hypothetical protein
MWRKMVVTIALAGALNVALSSAPADARRAAARYIGGSKWTLGVVPTPYGPYWARYGVPAYPSYWSSPTTGTYVFSPTACYAPRAIPTYGPWWQWQLEYLC